MAHPVSRDASMPHTGIALFEEQARLLLFEGTSDEEIERKIRVRPLLEYYLGKIIDRASSGELDTLLDIAIDQDSPVRLTLLIGPLLQVEEKMRYALHETIVKNKQAAFQMLLHQESVSQEMVEVALCEMAAEPDREAWIRQLRFDLKGRRLSGGALGRAFREASANNFLKSALELLRFFGSKEIPIEYLIPTLSTGVQGHSAIVKALLDYLLEYRRLEEMRPELALYAATKVGHSESVRALLASNQCGLPSIGLALQYAILYRFNTIVWQLLDHISCQAESDGAGLYLGTAFEQACAAGRIDVIRAMMRCNGYQKMSPRAFCRGVACAREAKQTEVDRLLSQSPCFSDVYRDFGRSGTRAVSSFES